jgi:membrane-associated protease RseP (regulator of RpoE activity)
VLSVLLMLGLLSLLIIVHELGHFWVAKRCGVKVERFGFGLPFGPTLWSKKIGETEYCIHPLLLGGYVSFPDDDPNSDTPEDSPRRFENQPLLNRAAIAIAGVTVNAVVGWLLMFGVILTWGIPTLDVTIGKLVSNTSPAAVAGIQPNEVIVKMNGAPVSGFFPDERLSAVTEFITARANQPVQLTLEQPSGGLRTVTVVPNAEGRIGVQLGGKERSLRPDNPLQAAELSTRFLSGVIAKNFEALGRMVAGKVDTRELSGPISIVNVGAQLIDTGGIQKGLILTAVISVILAVMNLLPIPALDGGHLLFIAMEAVMGRPVNKDVQQRVVQAGFLGLMLLMGFVIWNDIKNTWIEPVQYLEAPAKK